MDGYLSHIQLGDVENKVFILVATKCDAPPSEQEVNEAEGQVRGIVPVHVAVLVDTYTGLRGPVYLDWRHLTGLG